MHDYTNQKDAKRRPVLAFSIIVFGFLLASVVTTYVYTKTLLPYADSVYTPYQIGSWAFFNPFIWIVWLIKYSNQIQYPYLSEIVIKYAYLPLMIFFSFAFVGVYLWRQTGYQGLHGSARFQRFNELKLVGVLENMGVYIGGFLKGKVIHYLQHNGPEHFLGFAPTRSGKGVGLVIPTLLSWAHSALVLDIKGELFNLTSGFRSTQADNRIIRFEPHTVGSDGYNPMLEIAWGTPRDVAEVQSMVEIIIDPDGKAKRDIWFRESQSFIVASLLHIGYVALNENRNPSLSEITEIVENPELDIQSVLYKMKHTEHNADGRYDHLEWEINRTPSLVHPVVANGAQALLNTAEETMAGILANARSYFSLYKDTIVAKNTTRSDFKLDDIMNGDKPATVYIVLPPNEQARLFPLIRLFLTQYFHHYVSELDYVDSQAVNKNKHRCLVLLDEFTSLGRLHALEKAIAYCAGYGIKLYLICQNVRQLYAAYTREEIITGNCHIIAAFAPAPTDIETASVLSKMCGIMTVIKKKKNFTHTGQLIQKVNSQNSIDEVQRPLLTPDECQRIPGAIKNSDGQITAPGDMLIFIAGFRPIYGKQILFFKDPVFLARSKLPPYSSMIKHAKGATPKNIDLTTVFATKPPLSKEFELELPKATGDNYVAFNAEVVNKPKPKPESSADDDEDYVLPPT